MLFFRQLATSRNCFVLTAASKCASLIYKRTNFAVFLEFNWPFTKFLEFNWPHTNSLNLISHTQIPARLNYRRDGYLYVITMAIKIRELDC